MLIEWLFVLFMGLVLGSFATAITFRIPRNIPWFISPKKTDGVSAYRSHCPNCKSTLSARDLVPVLSWVIKRGRCRHCQEKIPPDYPLIETACLIIAFAVYSMMGLTLTSAMYYALIPFLLALLVIDLKLYILPNQLVLIVALLGLIHIGIQIFLGYENWDFLGHHIVSAFIYGFTAWLLGYVMTRFLKKDSLGFGDVKFFAAVGLWLGLSNFPAFLMLSGFLGVVMALAWKKLKGSDVFPFGPALILSFLFLLLFNGSHFY